MPKHTVCTTLAAALELVHAGSEKVLELDRWAEIGDSGATELASALRTNETLEVLILGSQNIGPAGAQVRFCFESIRKQTRHVLTVFCMGGRVAGHAASSSFVSLPQLIESDPLTQPASPCHLTELQRGNIRHLEMRFAKT
jgi:hypothetical protein